MKRYCKRLIAVTAGAVAAFVGLNCAPVDVPGPEEGKATAPPPSVPAPAARAAAASGDWTDNGLKTRIDAAIDQVKHRDLITTNGFWTVFHGILGLGPSVELLDPTTGKRVVALEYIAGGGEVRGLRFLPTPDGLDVETRPGTFVSQGHQDQFVAEMVEWDVSPDKKFKVNGEEHPFSDFTRFSKARASVLQDQELDWAVLIVGQQIIDQHYKPEDIKKEWTNAAGEHLCFEDLLRKDLNASMASAACGGTHRLFGLDWVYHLHLRHGGETTGVWKEIADHTGHYKDLARKYQNADGSFSTNFFREPGNARDANLRINTTGHTLEWLSLEATDDEVRQPWMLDAANALSMMILDNQGAPLEGGTLYHAVHGLLMYRSRVFGAADLGPNAPHMMLAPSERFNLPVPVLGAGRS